MRAAVFSSALPALVLLAVASAVVPCRGQAIPGTGATDVKDVAIQVEQQVTYIYSNGSCRGTWHDNSVGIDSNDNTKKTRNGSEASLNVKVSERGYLLFKSIAAHPADSILDFWVFGSGLQYISLFISDSRTKTDSLDVRFTSVDAFKGIATVLGEDDDGFIHFQVDLGSLRPVHDNKTSNCSSGVAAWFDSLTIKDIGFMGFRLVLDDVKLISKEVVAASDSQIRPRSSLIPVLGDDLHELKSGRNRYLMKIKPNASMSDIRQVCNDLASNRVTKYNGACLTNLATLNKTSKDSGQQWSWNLLTFKVKSAADLLAMRKSLGNIVDYFEADLSGFTTVRALRNAAANRVQVEIVTTPEPSPFISEDADPPQNPSWNYKPPVIVDASQMRGVVQSLNGAPKAVVQLTPTPLADDKNATAPGTVDVSSSDPSAWRATIASSTPWGMDRLDQVSLPLNGYYSSGKYDGRGVHIYVLDTGVSTSHTDFRGRVGDGASAVSSSVNDDNGHGTHVAGIALGSTHGVASSATLHPVKVMGSDGSGSYSNIIAGLQWVKDHKARNKIASAVITMSLAGPWSKSLNDAIDATSAAGIVVVTAAGNNRGGDSCSMSPCSASSAITVGASTDADALASFSNIGRCLAVFAPGNYITSASWQGDYSEQIMSGTSMATPHVAGAAALYLQFNPGAKPAAVKAAIQKAAVSKYFEGSSPQLLLNVMNARLQLSASTQPSTTTPTTTKPTPAPTPTPAPAPALAPKPAPSAPSWGSGFGMKLPSSICATCSWCQFC